MSPPRIAITACDSASDYVEAVRRAGGEPRVLAAGSCSARDALAQMDALLLSGGGDVHPSHYGAAWHASLFQVDPARDEFELDLVRGAVAQDLPVFGICRGLQVINVACGGTLVRDIPSEIPGALLHRMPVHPTALAHDISVQERTLIDQLLRDRFGSPAARSLAVNSRHHQAADRLATGFIVAASSSDGVVEAIERPASRFCVAVQWHPENFWQTGEFQSLFDALVGAAGC